MTSSIQAKKIKVIIVDDHSLVSGSIKRLLNMEPDIEVIAKLESQQEAIHFLDENIGQIDLVVLDLRLDQTQTSELGGFEVAEHIINNIYRPYVNEIGILIMSGLELDFTVDYAFRLGVQGYLKKNCDIEEMIKAIHEIVIKKNTYYRGEIGEIIANPPRPIPASAIPKLTKIEKLVLHLSTQGYSIKEIAKIRNRSKEVVEYHRSKLLRKFRARNVAQMVAIASRLGFIQDDIDLSDWGIY